MALTLIVTLHKDANWGYNNEENENSDAVNSEANTQNYLSTKHDNYQQNFSSSVASQPFILGYSSGTPDIDQQNSSSAIAN